MSVKYKKKTRSVKVTHSGIYEYASGPIDYINEFSRLHYPAYAEKYGEPTSNEEWKEYAVCLSKDLRKAMNNDEVPDKWKTKAIGVGSVVDILRMRFSFKNIRLNPDMGDSYMRAVYDEQAGFYKFIEHVPEVYNALQGLNMNGLSKSKCEDIISTVSGLAEIVDIRGDPDEIPCENYIYNDRTKEKIPYGENVYLTYRGAVDYNTTASNPHIHNDDDGTDWDFDSWLLDLFDNDSEMVEFFWQIVARLIRPFRAANGIVLFTATTGNNGKGTLIVLFRKLVGKNAWASVPLAEFAERFGLNDLINAQTVLTDENRMEFNYDGADRLKAAADGSTFKIEIKHKGFIKLRFLGLMIQCVNEMPRIKDKTGSWYRRLAVIPFTKSFTGMDRKYIKNDYLKRPEVLAYVKKRAIETKIEDIDLHDLMPQKCLEAFEEYKLMNDPIRQYWDDISPRLVWDRVPSTFLYDLYSAWSKRNNPSGKIVNRTGFYKQLKEVVKDDPSWIAKLEKNDTIRKNDSNDLSEELILEYNLENWMNKVYKGFNTRQRLNIEFPERFRGVIRVMKHQSSVTTTEDYQEPNSESNPWI